MPDKEKNTLIFVYNADSGLFNTMADIAHKMLSPSTYSCHLCAITHGLLSEKKEWRAFIEQLGVAVEFLHRDEFINQYKQTLDSYPVILQRQGQAIRPLISSCEINACQTIADLCHLIETAIHPSSEVHR
jgi:hypothetical protein